MTDTAKVGAGADVPKRMGTTEIAVLVSVMALAVLLRLKALTFQGLWNDELFSAVTSNPAFSLAEVARRTLDDVHPPLYQALLWGAYSLFGYSDLVGRLLSAVAGVLGVYSMFLLGRELFGRKVGLYAASIAAVNIFLIQYAQEVRSYALLFLLTNLSLLFFAKTVKVPRVGHLVTYIAVSMLLIHTHFFGLVAVAAEGAILLLYCAVERRNIGRLLFFAAVAALCLGLSYLPIVDAVRRLSGVAQYWIPRPEPWFAVRYFAAYFGQAFLVVAAAMLVGLAGYDCIATRDRDVRFWLLALGVWVGVSYFLPYVRSMVAAPILTPRNTIVTLPAIMLLCAAGIAAIRERVLEGVVVLLLLSGSLYLLFIQSHYYEVPTKERWREVSAQVAGRPEPKFGLKWTAPYFEYCFVQSGHPQRVGDTTALERALASGTATDFWLLDGHAPLLDSDLPARYGLVEKARVGMNGAAAVLYHRP